MFFSAKVTQNLFFVNKPEEFKRNLIFRRLSDAAPISRGPASGHFFVDNGPEK